MSQVIHYLSLAGIPASGVLQVETAVVVGTITTAGNATLTVTAAGMSGSPKDVVVALALNDDATAIATKFRAALALDADVAAFFTVSGSDANVVLTARASAANDATMNIAYADTTSDGLTDDATSNNTTAGVYGTYRGARPGVLCADTTNGKLYQNFGTIALPVWTAL
jgi:hypothetical protein